VESDNNNTIAVLNSSTKAGILRDNGWCEEGGWQGRVPGEEEEAAEEDGWEDEGADEVARAGRGLGREDGDVHLETGRD
jgi:hypothetical protein